MPSSNPPPDPNPAPEPTSDLDFEAELAQIAQSLEDLRDRYANVRAAQEEQSALRARQARVQHQLKRHRTVGLQRELAEIKSRLEELELTLESQLFSWDSLSEPFWQAVRFGGLGLLIGWFMRGLVG